MVSWNYRMHPDDLLRELRQVGRADSQGRFTLDPRVAREKLRRFRFRDRHEYILALLAAAVRAGASRFDVRRAPGGLLVVFDGRPFSAQELGSLSARPELADLADGLAGADLLELDSGPTRLAPDRVLPSPAPFPGTRILLGQARPRLDFRSPPEFRLLHERAPFAPLRVFADGRPLNRSVPLGDAFVGREILAPEPDLQLPRHDDFIRLFSAWEGPFSAVLGLGRPDGGGLRLQVAGVCFPFPHLGKAWPELRGVVAAPGLRLDLSRSGVVEDEVFARLLEDVEEQVLQMVQEAARERRTLSAPDLQVAVAMARRVAPPEGAVLELLLESLEGRTRAYDTGRLDLALRAMDGLRRQGQADEADRRFRLLVADLRAAVLRAWNEEDPSEAAMALAALARVAGPPWDEWAAECRSVLGDEAGAEERWREVLAGRPGHPSAVEGLDLCMRRRGRPGHPLPVTGTARSAWLRANAAMARGDLREAVRHYREALTPGPWGLLAWDGLAEALFLLDQPDRASEALSQGLRQRGWVWPLLTWPAQGHDGLFCGLLATAGAFHLPQFPASRLAAGIRLFQVFGGSGLLFRIPDAEIASRALLAQEDEADALRHWTRALDLAESLHGPVHPVREYLQWRLVHCLRRARRFAEADRLWARCDAIARWRWDLPDVGARQG